MDIKAFRALMGTALAREGLELHKLQPRGLRVWSLRGGEIVRFFLPNAHRRPWGFIYDGGIGVEIPALRAWLNEYKPGEQVGVFHTGFTAYHTGNDDVLKSFMIEHGAPVPAELWAGLIRERLELIPSSVDELVKAYRRNRDELGWLAHPHQRHVWEFLLKWRKNPAPSLHVPQMLPDGRIV